MGEKFLLIIVRIWKCEMGRANTAMSSCIYSQESIEGTSVGAMMPRYFWVYQ